MSFTEGRKSRPKKHSQPAPRHTLPRATLMALAAVVTSWEPAPAQTDSGGGKKFEIPIKFEFRLRSELRYNCDLKDAVDAGNVGYIQLPGSY